MTAEAYGVPREDRKRIRGAAELEALTAGMLTHSPSCAGDDRFIVDDHASLPAADRAAMFATCTRCPLRSLCRAYAIAGRPKAGYWAGRAYPTTPVDETP